MERGKSIFPPSPFKFNAGWLQDEDFVQLIRNTWVPFDKFLISINSVFCKSPADQTGDHWMGLCSENQREAQELTLIDFHLEEKYESKGFDFL